MRMYLVYKRTEQVMKGCYQIQERFAVRQVKKRVTGCHPKMFPHTPGRLKKMRNRTQDRCPEEK